MGEILNPQHLDDLHSSGLTDDTIKVLGFYSGTASQINAILGFDAGPGLVIPYPCIGGGEPFSRVKPDRPPIIDGKPAKYLSPKGARVRAYIPPKTWEALKCPRTPVIITEGEKKSAKADQEGFPCIGLAGVWCFLQEHKLIPDLAEISWKSRSVIIAYDSDIALNDDVKEAAFTLERELAARCALVKAIRLPSSGDGVKTGLDDFLVSFGAAAFEELLVKAKPCLHQEVEDIALLPPESRLEPLHNMFRRLAKLEPIEMEAYRRHCSEVLDIPRRDFQAQLKKARERFSQDNVRIIESKPETAPVYKDVDEKTTELLKDPALLYRIVETVHRLGIAGEEENICLLYLAMTSRILNAPLSVTLKGESSSGKSYLTEKVCQLFPPSAYLALTGMSRQALVYTEESFAHRTLIFFERPGMEAADYNIRTLQTENRIAFLVPEKDPITNRWVTRMVEKEGPTNFIFTTTAPELHVENETRHWSLLMDESPELTREAKLESAKKYEGETEIPTDELLIWQHLQSELRPFNVFIPYAFWLSVNTPNKPIRMRRDFNKLLGLIEVIAILYQHQRQRQGDTVVAGIEDYFIARELINRVFTASLTGINQKVESLASEIQLLYKEKMEAGDPSPAVRPLEIARALDTSSSSVSRWLRPAIDAGLVEIVRETAKGRIASVKPGGTDRKASSPLPTIEELAEAFPELVTGFHAVHPITENEYALEDTAVTVEKIFSPSS